LELDRILADREMRDCLLMVFANKQDLPGCEYFILLAVSWWASVEDRSCLAGVVTQRRKSRTRYSRRGREMAGRTE
jgi:hypothetical protein